MPHFQGGICHLSQHPHGRDVVVLPGAVQSSVRILFSNSFWVDPVELLLENKDWEVLPILEQKKHIGSFPIRTQILQQIVLLYGLAVHLQMGCFEYIIHLTAYQCLMSCSASVVGMLERSSLNLSLGWFSFHEQANSWQTVFLWLSSAWAASLANASLVFPSEAAISRAE